MVAELGQRNDLVVDADSRTRSGRRRRRPARRRSSSRWRSRARTLERSQWLGIGVATDVDRRREPAPPSCSTGRDPLPLERFTRIGRGVDGLVAGATRDRRARSRRPAGSRATSRFESRYRRVSPYVIERQAHRQHEREEPRTPGWSGRAARVRADGPPIVSHRRRACNPDPGRSAAGAVPKGRPRSSSAAGGRGHRRCGCRRAGRTPTRAARSCSRLKTAPTWSASSHRSRNSVLVRSSRSPHLAACAAAGRISRSPMPSTSWSRRGSDARRSRARTRAASSRATNGFVT